MSLLHSSPHQIEQIPLAGIGSETATTIQRAVELYGDKDMPPTVLEAARMLTRSEIRSAMQSGQNLANALNDDREEILRDVADHKHLGVAETTYAEDLLWEDHAPEKTDVDSVTLESMNSSLQTMAQRRLGAERQAAQKAHKQLRKAQRLAERAANPTVNAKMISWLGQQTMARYRTGNRARVA